LKIVLQFYSRQADNSFDFFFVFVTVLRSAGLAGYKVKCLKPPF